MFIIMLITLSILIHNNLRSKNKSILVISQMQYQIDPEHPTSEFLNVIKPKKPVLINYDGGYTWDFKFPSVLIF